MSTDYGWEGLRQICPTLLGARHVPERFCGGIVYLGRYNKLSLPYLKPNTDRRRDATVELSRVGVGVGGVNRIRN